MAITLPISYSQQLPPLPLFFIVVLVAAATAATESNGGIVKRGRETSAGANASALPIVGAMPLLPLPGAILTLLLASLESGRRSARGEGPRPQTRRCNGLLLPPLERDVDNDDDYDVAAGGTPAAIGTWATTNTASSRGNIF
jgi:hypothetical protein